MHNIARIDALYARQSVDKKDSISIESQLEFCKYETHGAAFRPYKDKGYSGKNTNRPDFERLMRDIRAGLIRRVIVYKLDRISRSILDFANMMAVFQSYNVEFVSCTEKFDTATPLGRAMLNICIVFAQLERETIQMRVSDAYRSRSKKGYYMGGNIPYGFRVIPAKMDGISTSQYEVVEDEMQQVELIYRLYSEGVKENGERYSTFGILNYLVDNKIPHLRGGCWNCAHIQHILANPVYAIADLELYEFFKAQGTEIVNPIDDWQSGNGCYLYNEPGTKNTSKRTYHGKVVVLAPHKGRIPSDVWIKCRLRAMNHQQMATSRNAKTSWLVGKVKCANCGRSVIITRSSSRKQIRYMNCSFKYSSRGVGCNGTGNTIYADEVENYILEQIKSKLAEFVSLSDQEQVPDNPKLSENKIRVEQIDAEIDSLISKVSGANETLMHYINTRVEKLDAERQALCMDNVTMNAASMEPVDTISIYDHISAWESITLEDKQKVADALIKVIKIGNGQMNITWNI